jgi:hypothetical protein
MQLNTIEMAKTKGNILRPNRDSSTRIEVWTDTQATKNYKPRSEGGRVIKIDPETVHNLAMIGLSPKMVAAYHGMREGKFHEACEDYPDLHDAYLIGMGKGVAKVALALDKQIEDGNMVSTIFKLKAVGGWIEADKVKDQGTTNQVAVQVYLPSNDRDDNESND